MKYIENFFGICALVIIVPIFAVLAILTLSILGVVSVFGRIGDSSRLRKSLKQNNGRIFFIYADYNNFNFSETFQLSHPHIVCVKTKDQWENDLFIKYLTKGCLSKSYPRLVKIDNKGLTTKAHNNSFKYYYRKNGDIDGFISLVDRSIKNLVNEN